MQMQHLGMPALETTWSRYFGGEWRNLAKNVCVQLNLAKRQKKKERKNHDLIWKGMSVRRGEHKAFHDD